MYELTSAEIDMVSGADGFFEKLGNALDNPWTTAGKVLDKAVEVGEKILSGEITPPPIPHFASH